MPNDVRGDVLKMWLYAAVSVVLGAWIAPLLYNAGKALAEISAHKITNDFIERIAVICRAADFPRFYEAGLLLAACLMFFPSMEWLHARSADAFLGIHKPCRIRLADDIKATTRGQRLLANLRGPWLACAGFLIMTGLLIIPGIAFIPAGASLHILAGGILPMTLHLFAVVFIPAAVMEIFFRGIVMGVFLRSMRPSFALGMSAAFFAIILSLIPPAGLNVADSDAAGIGFELLGKSIVRFANWKMIVTTFVPFLMLGGLLGYARLRTASLGPSIGLHIGWLTAKLLLELPYKNTALPGNLPTPETVSILQQGIIPLAAILLTTAMVHFLTATPHDDPPSNP